MSQAKIRAKPVNEALSRRPNLDNLLSQYRLHQSFHQLLQNCRLHSLPFPHPPHFPPQNRPLLVLELASAWLTFLAWSIWASCGRILHYSFQLPTSSHLSPIQTSVCHFAPSYPFP